MEQLRRTNARRIPYGSSDTRIGFATVPVAGLLDAMVPMVR
ncbi:hypothetical protein [Virgisporangium ochraceum]|uniref:Uncharacterized protein n=1 Tax=Virgisporangium ochraceum TaxID=65505 RepID=A0A8J4A598_9ACTN|nr:hypothetical protein [Virgisporangium ochraceum]GIJ74483.1 hypothetical protein Voc01_094000 [Virgisporangium ochraceum]